MTSVAARPSQVSLTLDEARAAYRYGLERERASTSLGMRHRFGWQPDRAAAENVNGYAAVAELLVAKALGLEWNAGDDPARPDRPDEGDVGGYVSVRWTPRQNGSLIVHEDEVESLTAVLVVGEIPGIRIAGWLPLAEAKRPEWWRVDVRHPAYFVPQSSLRPIDAW